MFIIIFTAKDHENMCEISDLCHKTVAFNAKPAVSRFMHESMV